MIRRTFKCPDCGRTLTGAPVESFTGRKICEDCQATLAGAAAGVMAGGGIGGAISTAGWLRRIKSWRRRTD